jgi:serine/threonine-protein kinase
MLNTPSQTGELKWSRAVGELIGDRYEIVGQLGGGGMGELYEVVHRHVGRHLALKLLRPHLLSRTSHASRFEREARAAGRLDSIHIVPTVDFGKTADGSPYYVMELLKGEDLRSVIQRGPIPTQAAVEIIRQAAIGLAVAHRDGIVHRDIKPANIFVAAGVDDAPLVKVLDFGIAKLDPDVYESVEHTMSGAVLGTAPYMSPEQARGSPIDARSDIYSLGIVLYEALTGRRPFSGQSYNAIIYRILTASIEPVTSLCPEIPPTLAAIVDRLVSRDVAARFSSAEEVVAALTPFATGAASLRRPVALALDRTPAAPCSDTTGPLAQSTVLQMTNRGATRFRLAAVGLVSLASIIACRHYLGRNASDPQRAPGAGPPPPENVVAPPSRSPTAAAGPKPSATDEDQVNKLPAPAPSARAAVHQRTHRTRSATKDAPPPVVLQPVLPPAESSPVTTEDEFARENPYVQP